MVLKNSTYDILKWIGLITVPVITFLTAIVNIWGIPYGDQIVATLAAADVLIGSIVAVANAQYRRKKAKIEEDTYY